jgi:hypothetical protein
MLVATTPATANTAGIMNYARALLLRLLLSGLLPALCLGACRERDAPVLTRILEAQRTSAELLVQFSIASDASNRSVMADTDEASKTFAVEAEQHKKAIAAGVDALSPMLRELALSEEASLLQQFGAAFARYRQLDGEILALAVENTNLKAQRLSFGAAHEAADAVRAALEPTMKSDAQRARALATSAVLALREIEVLQGPHIAAADDAVMSELEQRMTARQNEAQADLKELSGLGGAELTSGAASATAALAHFSELHQQLVALSRRNSNVRSLALTLGQKQTLTAACQASLIALRDRLQQRDWKATR